MNRIKEIDRSTIKLTPSVNFYLESVWDCFDRIVPYTTSGDIRPPYPFQWIAYSKVFEGDDDPYMGVGSTPFEALKDLYQQLKSS